MSKAMTSVAWELDLPLDPKILLMNLAFFATARGRIRQRHPGELALMCGLSLTLVQKILRDFIETGVLVVEVSDTANGRSPAYRLDLITAAALFPRTKRIPYPRKRPA